MPGNLLQGIIDRFNVGVLHVFNVGRWYWVMIGGDFDGLLLRASDSDLENLTVEGSRVIKPLEW